MNHISSYPSVYALGHKAITELFSGPVVVEEKIDGSQFSMCRTSSILSNSPILSCRSKGKDLIADAPEKMFERAVATANSLDLRDGWTYRCEYLQSPKHNTLTYARVPSGYLILFDVMTGPESYLSPVEKCVEAKRIGLECVPLFHDGTVNQLADLAQYLNRESCLGGCKIEGVVVKNYALFTVDKKVAVGKYVSEDFKEKHVVEWKKSNPGRGDVVEELIKSLRTHARWNKSIQHLRDAGRLTETPQDIGSLLKEVQADTEREESDAVKDVLFRFFWPQIKRGITYGLPEFYKERLAQSAFPQCTPTPKGPNGATGHDSQSTA